MKDGTGELLEAARGRSPRRARFDAAAVEAALSPLPEALGVKPGKLYQPIRVAITGTTVSPGIFESLALLGREAIARADRRAPLARLSRLDIPARPAQPTLAGKLA